MDTCKKSRGNEPWQTVTSSRTAHVIWHASFDTGLSKAVDSLNIRWDSAVVLSLHLQKLFHRSALKHGFLCHGILLGLTE